MIEASKCRNTIKHAKTTRSPDPRVCVCMAWLVVGWLRGETPMAKMGCVSQTSGTWSWPGMGDAAPKHVEFIIHSKQIPTLRWLGKKEPTIIEKSESRRIFSDFLISSWLYHQFDRIFCSLISSYFFSPHMFHLSLILISQQNVHEIWGNYFLCF